MTAAEVRRAMWLVPLYMAVAVLAAVARIAVAAIEEEISLLLAVLLVLGVMAGPTFVAARTRRRYRTRLDQLRDPMTGSLPVAEPLTPLPMRLRLWLIGVPVLVGLAMMLAVRAPGAGNTCVSKGIATAAAHEGICQRGANLFGRGVTFNVVDSGHVLHMPGYDAQLLATRTQVTQVSDAAESPSFYPNGTGTLVSLEVAITNRGSTPLSFDGGGSDVGLLLQSPTSAVMSYYFHDVPDASGEPTPSVAALPAIQPGQTAVAWVAFVAPQWAPETLNARATDLEFLPPTIHKVDSAATTYLGQIRLWKAANAAGARALANDPTA